MSLHPIGHWLTYFHCEHVNKVIVLSILIKGSDTSHGEYKCWSEPTMVAATRAVTQENVSVRKASEM